MTELAHTPSTTLESIDDLKQDAGLGTKNIGSDIKPPQLKLCQSGTPEKKLKLIDGLDELDFFNRLSGTIYGQTARCVVVNVLGHNNVQFKPGDLGTVLARDIPDNDPRCQWPEKNADGSMATDADGKVIRPAATCFHNFLLWMPEAAEIVVFSISSTQVPVARRWYGLLNLPLKIDGQIIGSPPSWARTYELSSRMETKGKLAWGAINVKPAGITDAATRKLCRDLFEQYTTVDVDYAAAADTVDAEPVNAGESAKASHAGDDM